MTYNAQWYMHDLDRKAYAALMKFPKIVKLQKAYIENVDEKKVRIELLSSAVRLGEDQMPEVYQLLFPIVEKLGIPMPELYLQPSVDKKDIGAITMGATHPFILVTSELVKQFPSAMISSVLAHECGHIACEHLVCHSLALNIAKGVMNNPFTRIPAIKQYLDDTLIRGLLFWNRCSELSADRAAVLCDGNADTFIDTLMRVHGFDESINRQAFISQAMDLKELINGDPKNKLFEQMMFKGNSHPMLATRAYECYDWERSETFHEILAGTYKENPSVDDKEEKEVIFAEINPSVEEDKKVSSEAIDEAYEEINRKLQQVNGQLERYTSHARKEDYAYAIACGLISGAMDSVLLADGLTFGTEKALTNEKMEEFVINFAKEHYKDPEKAPEELSKAIGKVERTYKVPQDAIRDKAAGISRTNHHLTDLAHHPTPVGLASSILVQFLRTATFVNKDGDVHLRLVKTDIDDMKKNLVPAIITGLLNWLVSLGGSSYEDQLETEIPEAIKKLARLVASSPQLVEVAKCANRWFGHLVSDMHGTSGKTAGKGMGIPGVFLSLLYEISALPGFKETNLSSIIDTLYVDKGYDLRDELTLTSLAGKQAIPVLFNEVALRLGYFLVHLGTELIQKKDLKRVNWSEVIPFGNRTIDRMLAVSTLTFTTFDAGDAAVRALAESGGNAVVFLGRFACRYNFVGAGRATLAVVKELSNEEKETQLIHERMLLMDAKAALMYAQLQAFKEQLELKLSNYLAEDIEAFLEGFDDIQAGLETNDSNLVIRGNVVIQRVLGREPQFTTQEEFDELMESDEALIL